MGAGPTPEVEKRTCSSCGRDSEDIAARYLIDGRRQFVDHAVRPDRAAAELATINRFRTNRGASPMAAIGDRVTLCRICHPALLNHIRDGFRWLEPNQGDGYR